MSARGGTKKDLLAAIRKLQRDNQKLWDLLKETCDWIESESGQHPSHWDQDTTPAEIWRFLSQKLPSTLPQVERKGKSEG